MDTSLYYAYVCKPKQTELDGVLQRFLDHFGYMPLAIEAPKDFPPLQTGLIRLLRKTNIPPGHVFLETKQNGRSVGSDRPSTTNDPLRGEKGY
jgi:hypothetical protein